MSSTVHKIRPWKRISKPECKSVRRFQKEKKQKSFQKEKGNKGMHIQTNNVKNFTKLMTPNHRYGTLREYQARLNTSNTTFRQIKFRPQKVKDKETLFKGSRVRGRRKNLPKRTRTNTTVDLSSKMCKQEDNRGKYVMCWNKNQSVQISISNEITPQK